MSATARLRERFAARAEPGPLKALAASGQLGYGIPEVAFRAGLAREPDFIGCDMGSIDPGPYYLGAGRMATSSELTRRDLALVLHGARDLDVPLLIGSAGTAGAAPHLAATVELIRDIVRADGLRFRLATIGADMPKPLVQAALRDGTLTPLGAMPPVTADDIEASDNIVGQMGTEAFRRALDQEPDVILAGRACDTAVFAAVPQMLGYDDAASMHMAKIIECTSICCEPGGRDAMLGTLEGDSFVLESMNPDRHATPMSVAAHALYEQADPYRVAEPDGVLHLDMARYEAVDAHRCRVTGARWEPAARPSVKIEGAARVGERAVLLCASADPRFIASLDEILPRVEATVRELVAGQTEGDFDLQTHVYGRDGIGPARGGSAPQEVFVLVECIAASAAAARMVAGVTKQYLLHHGFPGRLSTGGNLAFPFTPPELAAGTAYRFTLYHVMPVDDLASLFPVSMEEV